MPPSFPNEPIRLSLLPETILKEMTILLDRQIGCSASKPALVYVEPTLLKTFKHVGLVPANGAGVEGAKKEEEPALRPPLTKERGVAAVLPFSDRVTIVPVPHLVYFVRPQLQMMPSLAAHILAFTDKTPAVKVSVVFVSKRTLLCEHALLDEYHLKAKLKATTESNGSGNSTIHFEDFDLDLVPIDEDVLSMEMNTCFQDLFLNGDVTPLNAVARSIVKLQTARFGQIPQIKAKGEIAHKVLQILQRLQENEIGNNFLEEETPEIESLYIVDRTVDLMTPLMHQLTYEGLLAEFYGIDHQTMRMPQDPDMPPVEESKRPIINVDANDKMFADIRDLNFARVGFALREKSMYVKEVYEKKNNKNMDVKELQDLIALIPSVQELKTNIGIHTTIATCVGAISSSMDFRRQIQVEHSIIEQKEESKVIEYIEELICKSAPLTRVTRLICLLSIVNSGLKPKYYDYWKESLMTTYGIPEVLCLWENLEKVGLIAKAESQFQLKNPFQDKRRVCRLWDTDLNEKDPQDFSYTYAGYAPLLARTLEGMGIAGGDWQEEMLDFISGEHGELQTNLEVPGNARICMIFVVGGVTHAEISALRFLNKKLKEWGHNKRFVFAATNITSGQKMMESLMPFVLESSRM